MNIIDLNRNGGIGCNSMFLEIGPFRLLIDSGLDPKTAGLEATPDFSKVPESSIDFIILTHCHLDHLGSLPLAALQNPLAPIFMSKASAFLANRMMRNSINVMKRQREELGIHEYPLYTHKDLQEIESRYLAVDFGQTKTIRKAEDTLKLTLHRAGHVAGAVSVDIEFNHRKIFATGDILFTNLQTLKGADVPQDKVDIMIIETTRGLTKRSPEKNRAAEKERFINSIKHTLEKGGSCLIPVFALGRTQEVLSIIHKSFTQGEIPKCPVFCSGMGLDLVSFFDRISKKTGQVQFNKHILKEMGVKPTPRNLTPGKNPSSKGIYIVSSGMLVEHTPSYKLAASMLGHPTNTILFVGYCDPETPGGELLEANQGDDFLFKVLEFSTKIKAKIEKFDMSGHADREEILALTIQKDPRVVVLTHGDPGARDWFKEQLNEKLPNTEVLDPVPLSEYTV
jgi:Cft2 family RNA processing exonuclease